MKISLRWLARHLDLEGLPPERIRDDLSLSTAEIEGLHEVGTGLSDLVVGHVVSCARHPDADKLSVTQVDAGLGELVQIVCGARNVAAGQQVAVILPGSSLPDGTLIQKTRIRGVESLGMLCSERELGLSDEHSGILVLDGDHRPGQRLLDVLPLRDTVLEIDNKSINHRPDLWGHRGFARELAAIHRRPLLPLPEAALDLDQSATSILIENLKDCPRYLGLVLMDVTARPSPAWLRGLLQAVGQRSIDLLVDLTNFVMLDLGQPLHAFDLRAVDEQQIMVRRARAGESMTTLDGIRRNLETGDILITSADRPVAIAGVMGALASGIQKDTTALFLESATFHPATVRRTSARLGLRSEASTRFEKSLDPAMAETAARQFVAMLQAESSDLRIAGPLKDPAAWQPKRVRIPLRMQRLHDMLGVAVERSFVAETLRWLEFDALDTAEGFDVGVPSFRATKDISIEQDLIEEVGRLFRYDNIPEVPLSTLVTVPHKEPDLDLARRLIQLAVTEMACHEVYNYSFVPDSVLQAVGADAHAHARVVNPVAPDLARIRRHVLPSTLAAAAPGLRTHPELRFVEHGKGYDPTRRDAHDLPVECREIAFVWLRREGLPSPYAELRSHLWSITARCARTVEMQGLYMDADTPWTHPGRTVELQRHGSRVGYVGVIHPAVARALEIPATTALASLDVRAMLQGEPDDKRMRSLPRFPSQPVDVALLVPEQTQVARVAQFLRASGPDLVQDVVLFEVYRGEGIPAGVKSLNFTVTLQAEDRTLTAKDEEVYLSRVRETASEIGAGLRG